MRAREPVESGRLRLQGFEIAYEVFGSPDAPPLMLLPTWQIVPSRIWKMQVPFLARTQRVIVWDPPGNGGGERTLDRASVEYDRLAAQALGLLDHLGVPSASMAGYSRGCWLGMTIAASQSERVSRLILIGGGVSEDPRPFPPSRFLERRESYSGWEKMNAHYWSEHYLDWLDFFFHELFSEPHSTKQIEDGIGWGLETTAEILGLTVGNPAMFPTLLFGDAVDRIRCPVLLIHGDDDRVGGIENSRRLAALRPDWELLEMQGCGHGVMLRDPVSVNLAMRDFLIGMTPCLSPTYERQASDARA